MEENQISGYQVKKAVTLPNLYTSESFNLSKKKLEKKLAKVRKQLGKLQNTLYAHDKYSVLICLQGMDTSGKDSLIREVFKDFNASGVEVTSFKVPTDLERSHDYLWRHYIALPARGKFGVFNRTHYENVLVTRVHPNYILGENLPNIKSVTDVNEAFWDKRFEQINAFEKNLAENGTLIFKFYMNLSKEEQKFRLLRRLNIPEKNWKFSAGDLEERKLWDKYMEYYQDAINRTSKPHAPWYIIPADNKPAARLIVASILLQKLKKLQDIKEPEMSDKMKSHISEYKKQLQNE
ncbi:MAG: polyphosphate kinase 2 family protein [Flavobacteriaceae bacterium]|nr:polyphosphate kinase 2 family protein [Flavobacteriaceae bacterium]